MRTNIIRISLVVHCATSVVATTYLTDDFGLGAVLDDVPRSVRKLIGLDLRLVRILIIQTLFQIQDRQLLLQLEELALETQSITGR